MKVISLTNGSLISHTTAIYAIHYAKQLNYNLDLIHIKEKDDTSFIQDNVEDIINLAKSFDIETNFLIFDNIYELEQYINLKDIDMVFCSTRQNKSIYDKSFVTKLISHNIKTDLCIAKIVKIGAAYNIDKIIMPIRGSKLSVKKFTLFSNFSLSYKAKSEVYSVDKISKINFSFKSVDVIKQKLQDIIFDLRHYIKLSNMIGFKFAIKHDYVFNEGDKIQTHIAQHNYDLIIMGGHHEKSFGNTIL